MLTLSAPRTSWGSKGSFTMWKSSYRSSICGQRQRTVVRGIQGKDRMWVNGSDQAEGLPGSEASQVTGRSNAGEVRDAWAGHGKRYSGQASSQGQN